MAGQPEAGEPFGPQFVCRNLRPDGPRVVGQGRTHDQGGRPGRGLGVHKNPHDQVIMEPPQIHQQKY